MGFTPQQVNAMSIWQFLAAADGYIQANTSESQKNKLSESEQAELFDWVRGES